MPMLSKPICNELLDASLQFFARWDLDSLPLVSRRFCNAYERRMPFPQRRLLDCVVIYHDGAGIHTTCDNRYKLNIANGIAACLGTDPDYNEFIRIDAEQLELLLLAEPILRARRTTVVGYGSLAALRKSCYKFSTIWKGAPLEIRGDSPTVVCHLSAELFSSCSSASVQNSFTAEWLEEVSRLLPPPQGLPKVRCPSLELKAECRGITLEDIVDYLFTPASSRCPLASGGEKNVDKSAEKVAGEGAELKKELRIGAINVPSNWDWSKYSPDRLGELIEKRFATLSQHPAPRFFLYMTLTCPFSIRDEDISIGVLVPNEIASLAAWGNVYPSSSDATQARPSPSMWTRVKCMWLNRNQQQMNSRRAQYCSYSVTKLDNHYLNIIVECDYAADH